MTKTVPSTMGILKKNDPQVPPLKGLTLQQGAVKITGEAKKPAGAKLSISSKSYGWSEMGKASRTGKDQMPSTQ